MNKKHSLLLLIFIIIAVFTSCNDKLIYSAPSTSQVQDFISKNSINTVGIKELSDFTVILFEDRDGYGHCTLYKDQNNKLYNGRVSASGNLKQPVLLGGVTSGKEPFVTVIISDEDMLQKAKEIEVTLDDGAILKENVSGKGTVVSYYNKLSNKKPMNYIRLIIYDKDMNKLYEK
jgi:hypothetical protein